MLFGPRLAYLSVLGRGGCCVNDWGGKVLQIVSFVNSIYSLKRQVFSLLVAGVGVGRLRFHHQPDSSARVCVAANAALQPEGLHR